MSLFYARRSRAEFCVVVTLGGDGMLTLRDNGRLTFGDAGIVVVAVVEGAIKILLCGEVKFNLLKKMSDNLVKAVAVSFLSAKRGNIEGDFKTSVSFAVAKRISSCLSICGDVTLCRKKRTVLAIRSDLVLGM